MSRSWRWCFLLSDRDVTFEFIYFICVNYSTLYEAGVKANLLRLYRVLWMCTCDSEIADKHRYGVVEHFVGHGVGRVFHSAPSIVHARKFTFRFQLRTCFSGLRWKKDCLFLLQLLVFWIRRILIYDFGNGWLFENFFFSFLNVLFSNTTVNIIKRKNGLVLSNECNVAAGT